jgi:hypothetical protein
VQSRFNEFSSVRLFDEFARDCSLRRSWTLTESFCDRFNEDEMRTAKGSAVMKIKGNSRSIHEENYIKTLQAKDSIHQRSHQQKHKNIFRQRNSKCLSINELSSGDH